MHESCIGLAGLQEGMKAQPAAPVISTSALKRASYYSLLSFDRGRKRARRRRRDRCSVDGLRPRSPSRKRPRPRKRNTRERQSLWDSPAPSPSQHPIPSSVGSVPRFGYGAGGGEPSLKRKSSELTASVMSTFPSSLKSAASRQERGAPPIR